MSPTVVTIICLCLASFVGLCLGSLKIKGIGIGVAGVLFAGLIMGHFLPRMNIVLDGNVLAFLKEFGLVLFIYGLGLAVGPNIFSALKRDGAAMNATAAVVVLIGAGLTALLYKTGLMNLPQALGLYAGAVTNTPALGAGQQILSELGFKAEQINETSVTYALSYPFTIIAGIIVFIILKAVFRVNITNEVAAYEYRKAEENPHMEGFNVVVNNPNFNGIPIGHFLKMIHYSMAVSRMKRGDEYLVPNESTTLQVGDILLLFGPRSFFSTISMLFQVDQNRNLEKESEHQIQSTSVIVSKTSKVGKPLKNIMGNSRRHWVISRVIRNGISHSPTPDFKLAFGDKVICVGKGVDVLPLVRYLGNSREALRATRFVPFFIGLLIGILIGQIPFNVPGVSAPIRLGTSGGPLITALLLSYRGSLGRIVFYTPSVVLHAFKDFGLILFLAAVGIASGAGFFDLIASAQGAMFIGFGILISVIPMLIVGFYMRARKKMNYLTLCGTLSGSMSNTSMLTFILNMSNADASTLGYSCVYPITLFLRILTAQMLGIWLS